MRDWFLLVLAAFAAGAINSVAGGGTLLTFPALNAALTPPNSLPAQAALASVLANATSTVALVPGAMAGAWGYRSEIGRLPRWGWWLLAPSFVGGLLGSLLLRILPASVFQFLLPWLILTAALIFAAQPRLTRWTTARGKAKNKSPGEAKNESPGDATEFTAARDADGPKHFGLVLTMQFFVALYGGYFGAGIGILMLAALGFMGLEDIHEMNALKNMLGAVINGVSVVVFVANGLVEWPPALLMAIAAIAGGYTGARTARRMNRSVVRKIVVAIGFVLAAHYFSSHWRG